MNDYVACFGREREMIRAENADQARAMAILVLGISSMQLKKLVIKRVGTQGCKIPSYNTIRNSRRVRRTNGPVNEHEHKNPQNN